MSTPQFEREYQNIPFDPDEWIQGMQNRRSRDTPQQSETFILWSPVRGVLSRLPNAYSEAVFVDPTGGRLRLQPDIPVRTPDLVFSDINTAESLAYRMGLEVCRMSCVHYMVKAIVTGHGTGFGAEFFLGGYDNRRAYWVRNPNPDHQLSQQPNRPRNRYTNVMLFGSFESASQVQFILRDLEHTFHRSPLPGPITIEPELCASVVQISPIAPVRDRVIGGDHAAGESWSVSRPVQIPQLSKPSPPSEPKQPPTDCRVVDLESSDE